MSELNRKYQILKDYVMGKTNWQRSALHQINLSDAVLRGIDLTASTLLEISMKSCNLEFADLSSTIIKKCNLSNARLKGTNFSGANLTRVNLSYAYLELACLKDTNFTDVDFSNAYLAGADLRGACLKGAKFNNTFVAGAIYDERTVFNSEHSSLITEMIYCPSSEQNQSKNLELNLEKFQELEKALNFSYRGVKYQPSAMDTANKIQQQHVPSPRNCHQIKKYRGVVCA